MNSLSSILAKSLATAVVTASALSGCAMMCRACGGRRCGAQSAMPAGGCKAQCGASKPHCAASAPKCGAMH